MNTKLVYIGLRKWNNKDFAQVYKIIGSDEELAFKKKLVGLETVGTIVTGERSDGGIKKSKIDHKDNIDNYKELQCVEKWSMLNRCALEEKSGMARAKKKHRNDIEFTIGKLKRYGEELTPKNKKQFAMWVFEQLS